MLRGTLVFEFGQLMSYWAKTLSSHVPAQVVVENISFGKHPKQYMMLYSPKQVNKNTPLILYYHGGGWMFGKPELFAKKAALFTSLGFQVVMPCYRKLPRYTGEHILEDVVLCTKKLLELKEVGKVHNLDKIILGGVSAGANLVALLYFNKQMHEQAGFKQDQFISMFLYAPPIDLAMMKRSPILSRYAGKIGSDLYNKLNPISFIENSKPLPILCSHGNKDAMVEIASSKSFMASYEKTHPGYMQYQIIENGCHLDSASWAHTDNELRKTLIAWLGQYN